MTHDPRLSEELGRLIQKAERSIRAARNLLKDENPDFAASRSYYGAFYAIQALLLSRGLTFSSHGATLSAFQREFIKTGLFSRHFGKEIEKLFKDRQIGDYDPVDAIDGQRALDDIELSKNLIVEIKDLLRKEDVLPPELF
jgi:uncharacterized protein (UPF0332 family)